MGGGAGAEGQRVRKKKQRGVIQQKSVVAWAVGQ